MMTPLHQAARQYAEAGIPVFPVEIGGKRPLPGSNGFKDATTDLDTIDLWWSLGDYNIAFSPASIGQCVIDLDGVEGENSWFNLEIEYGVPPTREVQTPGGGRHLYFDGNLPPSASRIAPKVDTRGADSYVLVPPSTVLGENLNPPRDRGVLYAYEQVGSSQVALLPPWVHGRLAASQKTANTAVADLAKADVDEFNLSRVLDILAEAEPGVIGCGSDSATLTLASQCLDFVSPEKAAEMMVEHWMPRCSGGEWTEEWIAEKVDNAAKYRDNPIGCDYVAPAREVFASIAATLGAQEVIPVTDPSQVHATPAAGPKDCGRFSFQTVADRRNIKPLEWLLPGVLPLGALGTIYAASQSFKSFLATDMGCSIATGEPIWGLLPEVQGPVIYAAGEGKDGILRDKTAAWQVLHGIDDALLGNFHVVDAPFLIVEKECEQFRNAIRGMETPPSLIIFDTYATVMSGMEEFALRDVSKFVMFAKSLIKEFGCTVLSVAHANEDGSLRGKKGLLHAFCDTMLQINRPDPSGTYVSLTVEKQKEAGEYEGMQFFLHGGETFGKVLAFQPVTDKEFEEATAREDTISPPAVYAALTSLGADKPENFATTDTVAKKLVQMDTHAPTDPDTKAKLIARVVRDLSKRQHRLLGYSEKRKGVPGGIAWYLKPVTPEDSS